MVPMEYRDPKRIRQLLIDIEKRVEMNPPTNIQDIVLEYLQGLSVKHEATVALASVAVHSLKQTLAKQFQL